MGADELNETTRTAMPFARLLGIEVVSASPDEVRARLDWDESRCTAGGILHGGAMMGLADSAGGLCAFLNLPDGATATATIESKSNFFRPVSARYVEATSHVLHQGRTTIVVETELRDADGRLVAKVTQTQAILGRG
jgi:1,4-dihydroxy-2-naphthoyl-CoA hydrolase